MGFTYLQSNIKGSCYEDLDRNMFDRVEVISITVAIGAA